MLMKMASRITPLFSVLAGDSYGQMSAFTTVESAKPGKTYRKSYEYAGGTNGRRSTPGR